MKTLTSYKWGPSSLRRRSTVHPLLRVVFDIVLRSHDCAYMCGLRLADAQRVAYLAGNSTKLFPESRHNRSILLDRPDLSDAADVAPCIDGTISSTIEHCVFFAGRVMQVAENSGIELRWGGNWDRDQIVITDQKFQDLWHYEVMAD